MTEGTREDEDTKEDVTFFREESNKEPVCDVKAADFKLEGGTAVLCPRGREKLESLGLE